MLATSLASSRPEKPSVAAAASWISSGVMPRNAMASDRADRPRRNAVSRPSSPFCVPAPAPPAGHSRHHLLSAPGGIPRCSCWMALLGVHSSEGHANLSKVSCVYPSRDFCHMACCYCTGTQPPAEDSTNFP